VRTVELIDAARDSRALPTEIWYPAAAEHAGADLAEDSRDHYELLPGFPGSWQLAVRDAKARAEGAPMPAIVFSHGFGGHRRQSTFFCTHLASHGYVVVSADHIGNTIFDMIRGAGKTPYKTYERAIKPRPLDVSFLIDQLLGGIEGVPSVDAERLGVTGHSFGGWTALASACRDARLKGALLLAPAGGTSSVGGEGLQQFIEFAAGASVPTYVIAAERDTVLPLAGIRGLYELISAEKTFVVINNADHMHFCDAARRVHELFRQMPNPATGVVAGTVPPFSELCPAEHAYDVIKSLGLAHLDATVRNSAEGAEFLAGNLAAVFGKLEIDVEL
jgi:predicted dienelactone hydrolase